MSYRGGSLGHADVEAGGDASTDAYSKSISTGTSSEGSEDASINVMMKIVHGGMVRYISHLVCCFGQVLQQADVLRMREVLLHDGAAQALPNQPVESLTHLATACHCSVSPAARLARSL